MTQAKFYYRDSNAPKPNKPNLIGSTVCIVFENRLLLEHRMDSDRWAVIGGSLHPDETLKDCAIREVREETYSAPSWPCTGSICVPGQSCAAAGNPPVCAFLPQTS